MSVAGCGRIHAYLDRIHLLEDNVTRAKEPMTRATMDFYEFLYDEVQSPVKECENEH